MTRIRRVVLQEVDIPDLGERIKKARLACDKSLTQLCKEVDMSRTYWYDIEADRLKGAISVEILKKIENALGVDLGVKFED